MAHLSGPTISINPEAPCFQHLNHLDLLFDYERPLSHTLQTRQPATQAPTNSRGNHPPAHLSPFLPPSAQQRDGKKSTANPFRVRPRTRDRRALHVMTRHYLAPPNLTPHHVNLNAHSITRSPTALNGRLVGRHLYSKRGFH
jgi:hypothetical protein